MKLFKKYLWLFIILFSFCSSKISALHNTDELYSKYGNLIKAQLKYAPFPHPKRMDGHTYNNQIYTFEEHYNDSTVIIFIPKEFQPKEKNDFVIHFHGWYNNVDSVLSQFKLIEQFSESQKNAILIIPEGPKNVPDSFGGKLEEENGFLSFMNEIAIMLYEEKLIKNINIGNIILSGHSGGYRVISYILMRGGLTDKIKEVYLFDGLYGQIEKYTYWLDYFWGKFINIFTKDGGTKDQSENLMECFTAWKFPFIFRNEVEISYDDLKNNRIIFIYSDLGHNDVIHVRSQFLKYLKASFLEDL